MEKLIITPKTKIFDLLEAYPELEEVLIDMAPEFKKLKNPVLRKTIAKIASVGQAAVIGGLNVAQMVQTMREKVGQNDLDVLQSDEATYVTGCPDWFHADAVVASIPVSEILDRGEQPVHEVLSAIKQLNDNEILEIVAAFVPAPLLDKTISLNYKHWLNQGDSTDIKIYFAK